MKKLKIMHIFHDWIDIGQREVTYPKRGPYDPRSDSARTYKESFRVCAKCGKEETYDPSGLTMH